VLAGIDEAQAAGDHKKAERLIDLLERGKTGKARGLLDGKEKAKKPPKVEVPRTLNDYSTKAYSEFYEACATAQYPAEIEQLEAALARMADALATARLRLAGPESGGKKKGGGK